MRKPIKVVRVADDGVKPSVKVVRVVDESTGKSFGSTSDAVEVKKKTQIQPTNQESVPQASTNQVQQKQIKQAPAVQKQPISSTGQKTPLELFKSGLATSQSSSPSGLRSAGIEPSVSQNTIIPRDPLKVPINEMQFVKTDVKDFGKDENIVELKPTNAQERTDPRTPKMVYNNTEYRKTTLDDGTEAWEKKDMLSGDFFVVSNPNSISFLNQKFGGEVKPDSEKLEKTREIQLKRREALLPLNKSLIGSSEEEAVPKINEILSKMGIDNDFNVEQIGVGYDAIRITNKVTGQTQTISLDNWSEERDQQESQVLRSFIESYAYNKDYFKKKQRINELSNVNEWDNYSDIEGMIEKNKELIQLKDEVSTIEKGRDRFINDNEYRATAEKNVKSEIENYKTKITQAHLAAIDLDEAAKSLNEEKLNLQEVISAGTISPEEAQARLESIQAREANLQATKESLSSDLNNAVSRKEFNENIVKDAYLINSERGNFLSGTTQAFTRGMEAPFRMILNAYERQTGQPYVEGDKSIFGDDEYGWGPGVSTLDYTKSENRSDFSKAIFGISESLGSALSGYLMTGGAMGFVPNPTSASQKAANLIDLGVFASMYNASRDQMEGEEWKDVPLSEKVFMSIALSAPQMVLEKFGLTEALRGTNFGRQITNTVLKNVFNEVPQNATSEMIEEGIKKNMMKLVGEGILRANSAGIVEGVTEASQYLTEVSIGEIYNIAKEKDFFDTPNNFMELVENIGENAKIGYIGGASLGAVSSTISTINKKVKLSKSDFEKIENTISDVNLNEALTMQIQQEVINGEITQEEADQKLQTIEKLEKELAVFPQEMSVDDKYEASSLLAERAKIQAEIEGKEKTLVQEKTERINEINAKLKEIGARKQNETVTEVTPTEETTTEVTPAENVATPPAETAVVEKPTVQIVEGEESSYTDPEGKFYSKEEVANMSPEALSQLTIVNPSTEVQARIEEVFPAEKTATNEVTPSVETKMEDTLPIIEGKIYSKDELDSYESKYDKEYDLITEEIDKELEKEGITSFEEKSKAYRKDSRIIENEKNRNLLRDHNNKLIKSKLDKSIKGITFPKYFNYEKRQKQVEEEIIKNLTNFFLLESDVDLSSKLSSILDDKNEIDGIEQAIVKAFLEPGVTFRELSSDEQSNAIEKTKAIFDSFIENISNEFNENQEIQKPSEKQAENVDKQIEQKIQENEGDQEAEVVSSETDNKPAKQEKKPRVPRKPKDTRSQRALNVETTNLEHIVFKYFIGGGKIDVAKVVQSLFGTKSKLKDKSIQNEYQRRIGLHKKGALTINGLAHNLWEENQDQFGDSVTDQDWRNVIETVIKDNNGTKTMIDELLNLDKENQSAEGQNYWENNYGEDLSQEFDDSVLQEAEGVLDNMTDEEIIQMAQEIEASEKVELKPSPSDKKTIDKAISFLDDLEKQLSDFGKGTLGVNIPVVVLRKAVQVANSSLKAGKILSQAVSDAVEYIKTTNFYSNLNNKQKNELTSFVNNSVNKSDINIISENDNVYVYHGGKLDWDIDSEIYVSPDKSEAQAYANGNEGFVSSFSIDKSKIASEDLAFKIIKEKGFEIKGEYTLDELKLMELIDPLNFSETAMSESDIKSLFDELKSRGFNSIMFSDNSVSEGGDIDNIVVFDRNSLNEIIVEADENNAKYLLENGYKPVIDGKVVDDFNDSDIEEYFYDNDEISMTSSNEEINNKSSIDKLIDSLETLDQKLSAFGKETLGMNIPVALLQTAVKVAKTSLKAGKALSEAITDAIDFIKNSDFYKGLSDSEQKTVVSNVESVFSGEKKFEEIVEKPKQETKTEPSKPKGENTSRQSERAIEMQEDENPELAKRIKGLSSYERQDQEEFFDNISSIIDDMGEVASVDFATNPSNNVPAEVREAILTIAAARHGSSAMEKQNRAIESNDDQLLAEAEYELEKSMLWNLEASQYATKAGQIIAFKNKIYNEFPAFFSLSKKKEFDNKFGAEQEVKEEIKELQDDISRGVDSIVDDLTTNEEIEALKAQVEELQSKLADSKKSAGNRNQKSDEKIKEIKQKRKDLFAQLKNESRGGQVSASIGFLNSNQIEIIGKIVASYIEEGIVRTDKIVNEIYRNLKDSYPALRKEHIRSIARENPDFETLQNNEAQKKEKTKLEKLQEKLANLQKGEGEITETINREDSDEVKQIKKQIEEEKILSPKVLRQLVKDYLRGNKMNYRSLADAIAQKSGKSIEEVQDLADLMEEKIRVKVEELVKKEHKKFIEKTNSSAEKTKTKDLKYRKQKGIATEEELAELDRRLENQRSKSEIKRIMQTIMMGGLGSSSDFRKAFEGRFGFKELSETTQKQVDALAFEIFDIQREVDKQIVDKEGKTVALNPLRRQRLAILQKKLNTLLESNKPWTVGKVLKEINSAIYIHILSGPVTFARAFIGGYVSGALGFGAYNFINIANYKHLARGYREMIKALPSAYIKAVQSRKTGVDFFGATGLSGEIGGDTFGAYESAIFKGLNDAMKNKETGKVLIKSYGQSLKVIHALGALDTFMNTVTGTFVGTVEASKKGEFNQINDAEYKQIAHEDWFYFLKSVEKLVDIQNPSLDFESRVKKIDSIVRQELGITGSRYNAKKVFTANRIQELRENALGKYFEQGVSLSKDASMMGKPDGLTGVLVDKLQKASTISDGDNTVAAILKFIPNIIFKFTRITGQVINKSFNNIPLIGIANAAIGVGRNMETGEFEYGFLQRAKSNPLLFKQRVATNLLTTATLIGAYALMFDDDDEEGLKLDENRPFDLRGFGGDKQVTDRKYENYRNLSISFTKDKNGKWTNYVELKLVPEMSAIAGILGYFGDVMKGDVKLSSDDQVQKVLLERFKKEGLSTRNIFKAMSENTKIFTESSFSSVGSISRNYKSGEQDGGFMGGIGNVALNLMVDNIKPLVEPRVVESVIKTVSKVNGSEEKELKDWEYFAKNLYGLDSFFSDNKTDVFGNTYKKESDYEKFMKDTFGVGKKRSEDFKDVALLYKFEQGANISKRKFTEMKPDSKEGFTVTYNSPFGKVTKKYLSADKSIVDETQSIQEKEFKRLVNQNYNYLNSLESKDDLEKQLKKLQDKSTEYAKKEIVKKYNGTKKIESIDR